MLAGISVQFALLLLEVGSDFFGLRLIGALWRGRRVTFVAVSPAPGAGASDMTPRPGGWRPFKGLARNCHVAMDGVACM